MKKLIFAGLLLSGLAQAADIVRIPNTPENWKMLSELRIDYMARTPEGIDILLDGPTRLKLMTRSGLHGDITRTSTLVMKDAEKQFEAALETRSDNPLGVYHTFEEMEAELKELALAHPDKANLFAAGTTHEGNPIYAMELKTGSGEGKPAYFVVGSHHAREWISVEVPLAFLKEMLNQYGKDEKVTQLMDTSVFVVVPMLNVDGSIYSRNKKPMWRKNRKPNESGGVGVDNNRNYSYKWGVSGASTWSGSDTYMGPCAMSEVENQAVRSLVEKYNFVAATSFHSYSELVLWPWSYTDRIATKDEEIFSRHGQEMADIMGYRGMQSSGLYPSAGDTDDFLYGEYGVLSYTVELGTRFVPGEKEYQEIVKTGPEMLKYLFSSQRERLANDTALSRVLASDLEDMVRGMTLGQQSSDTVEVSTRLIQAEESQLQTAMQRLDMDLGVQTHIRQAIQKARAFQSLEQ